jgi:hypothetical protein
VTAGHDPFSPPRRSLGEKAALGVEVLASYAVARWTLRRSGLRGAIAALRAIEPRRAGAAHAGTAEAVDDGRRLGRVVRRTLAVLPSDTRCLSQSLTLTRMLASRGVESELVIGVQPGERFAAHAWVEYEGIPLLPRGAGEFEELVTL